MYVIHVYTVFMLIKHKILLAEENMRSRIFHNVLYSRKYWQELNLAVEPKIAIARILADLNLAVQYGIALRIYANRWILIWRL